jgi:hypothetical protein
MSESSNTRLDIHYINLDLHEGVSTFNDVEFRQLDHRTRKLVTTLTSHGNYINLQGCRVDLWVFRQDGRVVAEQCEINQNTKEISVVFTENMLAIAPSVECEFVITYADASVLKFPHFTVQVIPTLVTEDRIEDVINEDEFNLFFSSLALMEEWITKFDIKYSSISEAFRKQLELVVDTFQLRGEDIDERFNVLYSTLDKTIRDDLMTTKNTLKAENEAYLVEARQVFAYNAKELEKRMNQLEKKEFDLTGITEQYRNFCQQMLESVEAIKEACLGVQQDLETIYTETVALKADVDKQLETIRTRFEEMQNDFEKAQSDRAKAYTNAEITRNSNYNEAEANRDASFVQAEANRDASFVQAENTRQITFEEMEVVRDYSETIRHANENQRITNEEVRIANEETRISKFNAMKEEFNIALQYRLLEE